MRSEPSRRPLRSSLRPTTRSYRLTGTEPVRQSVRDLVFDRVVLDPGHNDLYDEPPQGRTRRIVETEVQLLALRADPRRKAGLKVFDIEPPPLGHPLREVAPIAGGCC
jgi:hypothetical protein